MTDVWIVKLDEVEIIERKCSKYLINEDKYNKIFLKNKKLKYAFNLISKNVILQKYVKKHLISKEITGKPLLLKQNHEHSNLHISLSSQGNMFVLCISDSNVGVDIEERKKDLTQVIKWLIPENSLFNNDLADIEKIEINSRKNISILASLIEWCKIEAKIKLNNETLHNLIKQRNNIEAFNKNFHYNALIDNDYICVIAKEIDFKISNLKIINFSELIS